MLVAKIVQCLIVTVQYEHYSLHDVFETHLVLLPTTKHAVDLAQVVRNHHLEPKTCTLAASADVVRLYTKFVDFQRLVEMLYFCISGDCRSGHGEQLIGDGEIEEDHHGEVNSHVVLFLYTDSIYPEWSAIEKSFGYMVVECWSLWIGILFAS